MSIPDELRNIRDHLRSGRFGQREVWERQLEQAGAEIERLQRAYDSRGGEMDTMRMVLIETQKWNEELCAEVEQLRESCIKIALDKDVIIERLQATLRGLLDEVMCFVVDPPSAALNHAIEEASRALELKS